MSGIRSAVKIWHERRRMRHSFADFCERMVFHKLPRRVPARHHAVVCDWLQQLADDPEGGILIILMPPGGGKSMIAARALPAWVLGRQPDARIVMVTNAMPLAESHGRAIREMLTTKTFQHAFDITLSPSSAAAAAFLTTGGGEFFGVGSAGASLGRRAEWLIVDDPISGIEEAQSVTMLEKLHTAWKNNLLTRLTPGAKVVLIQQRLSANDLAGFIMANAVEGGRKVRVLRLPMICDDAANDPLGRAEGEELWPEYWTKGDLIDAQADSYKWATLYQQLPPTAVNAWCDAQDILTTPRPRGVVENDDWRVYIGIDVASSVGRGDATVIAVIAFEKHSGAMHLVDLWREQTDHATSVEALLDIVRTWKPTWIGIDNDGGSQAFVSHLKTRAAYERVSVHVEQMPMRGQNKEARAGALRAKIAARMLHVDRSAPWAGVVMRELTGFPNLLGSAVDDVVDALSLIARKTSAMMVSKPVAAVQREAKVMGVNVSLDDMWDCQPKRGTRI